MKYFHWVWAACLAAGAANARAERPLPEAERLRTSPVLRHLQPNPGAATTATNGPLWTVSQFHVPAGFKVELVTAEPDLHQPVAFAFDARGRIWVAEAYSYPQKRPAGEGQDKIVIFEDEDGDGKFEKRKVFAEGLNLVSGFEVGYGGVWIGAAPQLLFIPDRNKDDVPDGPPEVLLDGFGYQDTHECLNSFLWGPDGWLYGNQGVFNLAHIGKPGAAEKDRVELRAGVWRYHPVRRQFEVFAHGGSNPWGLDYDEHGQLFMTHCRSYWGGGCTTHVIQGGHYWNQANANYAPFIIANPPPGFPGFRNFMMASARYDHGAGGAGKPGSDAIYGGHSHVGTMFYQGDNWPDEFRGHLFTHNLGGHQMNQQVNRRLGSGFETVHAGKDQLFCTDPKYVAVDLQYGPDGAVYMIDWYDQQHCHNPDVEHWDRSNGRIYRMQYPANYKPVKVNLEKESDTELVRLLGHKNAWYGRTAQRLLAERAANGARLSEDAQKQIQALLADKDPLLRLHALWTANLGAVWTGAVREAALKDQDGFIRAWAIHIAAERGELGGKALELAGDSSALVRLYLASAIQKLPPAEGWKLAAALAGHAEDRDDRNLPLLLWDAVGRLMTAQNPEAWQERAFRLAAESKIPQIAEYIYWYASGLDAGARNRVLALLSKSDAGMQKRQMAGLLLALEGKENVPMPAVWKANGPALLESSDPEIRSRAEMLAAIFGDGSMFPRLRTALGARETPISARKHAFAVLSRARDEASLPQFLAVLDEAEFRQAALKLLGRFDRPEVSGALLGRFSSFSTADKAAALDVLTSKPSFALALLSAIQKGKIHRDALTAYHIRQLSELRDAEVDKRVTATWGRIQQTPAEKQAFIARMEKTFNEAPLWAYDGGAGREIFVKLCAQCHRVGNDGARIGPELTGAGKHGIRYFLDNIVDPNAVIGTDFQMTTVELANGETLSGIIAGENAGTLTLRTTLGDTPIGKDAIRKRETSEKSLMPEGLLEALKDREQIELLKFLTSN